MGLAGLLALALAAFGPGVDSAAHAYQLEQFSAHGWRLWDNYWYAGRYELVNYSVLFYPLAALVGGLLLAVLSVAGTAGLFASIVLRQWGPSARWSARTFALSLPALIVAAQYPFALGALLAMAALALLQRHRLWLAVLAALVSLLASPLAFLLLIVILAGLALAHTRMLRAWPLRSVAPVLALSAICGAEMVVFRAFPAGGTFPYPWLDLFGIVLFSVAGLLFAGRNERTRPLAGIFAAYLVLGVTAKLQPSALGGNVARLLDYAAVPLLTLVLAQRQFRPRLLATVALGVAVVWQVAPAYRNASGIALEQAQASTFWQPVFRFFDEHKLSPEYRVEVVATWGHWESYYLAGRGIPIARGWYRQDDFPLNQVLYSPGLTPARYEKWLHSMGVAYVLLPHDELDASSGQEARVLERSYAAGRPRAGRGDAAVDDLLGREPKADLPAAVRRRRGRERPGDRLLGLVVRALGGNRRAVLAERPLHPVLAGRRPDRGLRDEGSRRLRPAPGDQARPGQAVVRRVRRDRRQRGRRRLELLPAATGRSRQLKGTARTAGTLDAMRTHRLFLCALAAALAGSAAAVAGPAAPHATAPELVDLSVRPSAVSVAALPAGQGFAAAYDDRLTAQGLHYAERRGTTWHVSTISADISGRRVGREPSLAISPTGLRVLAFRTDLALKAGTPPNGVLYVARSFPGHPWFIEQLDVNGFGETTAFDRHGRPAIAYLVRLDSSDAVEVRLARIVDGVWQITKLEQTTYRQSVNGANASKVGLAFDARNRPWVSFVDARSRSLRIVTPGKPSQRIGTVPADDGADGHHLRAGRLRGGRRDRPGPRRRRRLRRHPQRHRLARPPGRVRRGHGAGDRRLERWACR